MSRFLLDANISPETAEFLRSTLGLDAVALPRKQLTLKDPEIVALAKEQGRVIITFDLDFGELYHFRERGQLGVIILRLEDQTVESANAALTRFFRSDVSDVDLERSLVVLEEGRLASCGARTADTVRLYKRENPRPWRAEGLLVVHRWPCDHRGEGKEGRNVAPSDSRAGP